MEPFDVLKRAAARKAQDGPVVDTGVGDEECEREEANARDARINRIVADLSTGEMNASGVGDEQDDPGDEGRARDGEGRVCVEIDPRFDLPQFLPPGVIDQDRRGPASADQQGQQQDRDADQADAKAPALDRKSVV